MGRKIREALAISASLIFFALIFAVGFSAASAAEPQNIFVKVNPERPNSRDGWFWEGAVKIEFRILNLESGIKKIYFSWDELRFDRKIEYREPFAPLEGERYLFAWGEDENSQLVNPVTKFFMQYRRAPKVQEVQVSGEYVKYGEKGYVAPETAGKTGKITAEAASTARFSPTPTEAPKFNWQSQFNQLKSFLQGVNVWVVFLIIGLALLLGTKFLVKK